MEGFLARFNSTCTNYTHVIHRKVTDADPSIPYSKPRFSKHYCLIPEQHIEEFYSVYLKTVDQSSNEDYVYVCEVSPTYSHLFFDLDFNFATSKGDVTKEQVTLVVKLLEAGIRKYVPCATDVSCIVLKRKYAIKKVVNRKIVYRKGLHIHFPLIISHCDLAKIIKKDMIKYLSDHWNSRFFDIDHVNTLDNVIDDHIFCHRTLQLYKSTRPDHYKDNMYLPFVATRSLERIDFLNDQLIINLVSKYNDMNRILSTPYQMSMIVLQPDTVLAIDRKMIRCMTDKYDDYNDYDDVEFVHNR